MSINHKEFKQQTDQIQMQKDAQQVKQENAHPQQVQKEPINIEQTATAQATVQVEGLEPVLLQLNDQGAYLTQAVQGQNIANVTEPAPLQVVADSFDDALMSLSYQDFVKMVGTYNRGQVELVDGKLQIINNHYFSMSKGKESINNRLVRERFLVLAMQKLGDQMTPELSDRFRRILQLDQEGTKSLPLTRKQIHDVLADVNMRTSEVSKILFLGSKADPAQSEFAKRADYMVAGNLSAYDRSHTTPETQERFRQEIKSIFKRAKRFDENLTTLSQHQMDNLVNGNIELVREQIYHSYRKSYEYRVNLEKGGSVDPKQFMDNSVPVDLVAAYTINLMAAATEEGKALVQAKLDDVLLRIASGMYRTKNSKDVQRANYYQAYKKLEIGDLSSGGSDGLEETVLERSQNSETLRENKERTNQGVADLAHLCDQFRELNVLKEKGLKQGISKEERIRMDAIATDLYTIMTQEKQLEAGVSPMGMVATQLEGTRFAEGYQQLRGMLTEGFSIKNVVRTLSYTTEQKESHTNQHLSERVQIPNEELETAKGMAYRLDMLEGHAREIASVVVLTAAPSEYIKKAKDLDIKVYQDIHDEMKKWKSGGAHKMEYSHQGLTFTLEQKESGLIDLLIDGTRITLPVNAGLIVDALETDMIQHEELYGSEPIKAVFRGLDPSEKEPTEWTHSRLLCLKYLQSKTGKAGDYFNNIATNVLRRFAIYLLSGDLDLEEINKTVKSVDRACKSVRLNGVETLELIGMAELQAQKQQELAGNEFLEEVPKTRRVHREDDGWTEEEHQVKDMIADCIFSADTWTTDQTDKPALLLQKTLEQHVDTLVLLARKPQMLEDMIKKIPLLQDTGLAEQMHEVLSSLMNNMVYRLAKAFVPDETLKSMIRQALHTDLAVEKMTEAEAKLENMMKKSMRSIQKHISSQTKDLFGDSDEETPQTASEEQLSPVLKQRLENDPELMRKYEFNRSVDKLGDMMRQAASGSRGQGRFMQLVLNSYFRRVSAIDRRAMFASALRDAKPIPNLPEDATKEDWDRANRQCMGANLGGFLKGAGPLLHKMLQGLPTEAMPEELRSALKDVKSNLAPIPEEIVRSQMDAMVARSHGLVDRIEIVRALGAASVGQAFLCKLHGPNLPETGKDVVVKLLRPDVRNRMEREKPIMLSCAKRTDENGGMFDTYRGQLMRIEEELDLTLEAKNVTEGKIYDKDWATVKSMKLSPLIEPTANSMVLERAPGTTVDKFLDEVRETINLLEEFYSYDKSGKMEMTISDQGRKVPKLKITPANAHHYAKLRLQMVTKLEQLKKRQEYMTQLAQTWVTEGIFGEGFYHGDLHAGNIMVDDEGLTVIDFGNATKLSQEQQVNVTRMVAAAAFGDMKTFRSGLHNLLEYRDEAERASKEKYYRSKEEELGQELEKIFALGNFQHTGQRIAVALLKAQELGIQVPPAIFNFSQCQIRLQNALSEMNDQITTLQRGMETIEKLDDQVGLVLDGLKEEVGSDQNMEAELLRLTKHALEPNKSDIMNRLDKRLKYGNYQAGQKEWSEELYPHANGIMKMKDTFAQYKKNGVPAHNTVVNEAGSAFGIFNDWFDQQQLEEMKQEYIDCMQHPEESEQRFDQLMRRLQETTNRDGELIRQFEENYKELYEVNQNLENVSEEERPAHEERIARLKDQLFEKQKELNLSHLIRSSAYLGKFREQLESRTPQAVGQMDQMLKPLFEDAHYGGATLQTAYEQFREAQQQDASDVWQKERAFFKEYTKALKQQYDDVAAAAKYQYHWEYQETFFEVMGSVITTNIGASLKRLGTAAVTYGAKLDAMNNDNRDYDAFEQDLKEAERQAEEEAKKSETEKDQETVKDQETE